MGGGRCWRRCGQPSTQSHTGLLKTASEEGLTRIEALLLFSNGEKQNRTEEMREVRAGCYGVT